MLDVDSLRKAVAGNFAAIRRVTRLEAQGNKIFPPTYEGGEYAEESRQVVAEGKVNTVDTVLLDSVQSQANRMELALLRAYDSGKIKMPLLQVDFAGDGSDPILSEIGRITALEAPHRICDAIFRDSVYPSGEPFRSKEPATKLSGRRAFETAVFELCPTALLFGFWDSIGPRAERGWIGAKVQRAMVSEIVGYGSAKGVRTSSRMDPLQIEKGVDIYRKVGGGWTFEQAEAQSGKDSKIDPSDVLHGNIPPTFKDNHGGVTRGAIPCGSLYKHSCQ